MGDILATVRVIVSTDLNRDTTGWPKSLSFSKVFYPNAPLQDVFDWVESFRDGGHLPIPETLRIEEVPA